MNTGCWMCAILVPGFALIGLLFGILKERAAKFVAGFNMLPQNEQNLYNKAGIAKGIRNSCLLWALIMLIGAAGCYFLSGYFAIPTYLVWLILFFKDLHVDAHKAFEKYLQTSVEQSMKH